MRDLCRFERNGSYSGQSGLKSVYGNEFLKIGIIKAARKSIMPINVSWISMICVPVSWMVLNVGYPKWLLYSK